MEGELDGRPEEAQEEQGQPLEQEEPEARQVDGISDYKPLLDAQDERIRELESQVAEAAKSREAADALAAEIERLRADAAEERVGYELRLAGARSVTAARALLGEHSGDVAALKAAEPWLFVEAAPQGGTTGLEPAGGRRGRRGAQALARDRGARGRGPGLAGRLGTGTGRHAAGPAPFRMTSGPVPSRP